MQLLIDASRANNEQKTGVEWYAYFVIEELKKIVPHNWQVTLFTREPLKGNLSKMPKNWQEKVLAWPPKRLWTQIRLSYEIYQFKKKFKKDIIVLFVPAHVLPFVCPAKTIITVHDLGGVGFSKGYSLFERFYTLFSTWWALKRGLVVVPSRFVLKELTYLFKKTDQKIKVVSNAYDVSFFKPIDFKEIPLITKKYGLNFPYFVSIGRLEEKKNTLGIIRAFNILRNRSSETFQLLLLGKPGFGFNKIAKEIKKSPFYSSIIMPGWVEQKDVPSLMAGGTALLLPSFYEGFGIPILEAMALGVPVITSNLASMPEVAEGAASLVNPYRPQEIAEAMEMLFSEKGLRENLIAKGLERSKYFNWSITAKGILSVVEELN